MRNFLLALGVIACAASSALADAHTFGAEAFGAYNTYDMKDINDFLGTVNAAQGTDFEKIENNFGGGFGLRMSPNAHWTVSAIWEPLLAQSTLKNFQKNGDRLNLNANSYQLGLTYWLPTDSNTRYGILGAVASYRLAGRLVDTTTPTYADLEGNGIGYHGMVVGEWAMHPGLAVTVGAGYRFAEIDIDDTSPTVKASYSGFMGRIGLAFDVPVGQ